MSKSKTIVLGLCLVAFAAGCARKAEEVVYVEPVQPIAAEPVYSKY
ncbi:hypothetical protein OCGS_0519 [Oceaniovalibus guishaninsula JLT2003]|uniref:Lipoprotein n=1 Tax=Oceaniovalibus guishaninsula JLT2003 TaxID=1231392 RepID=K2HRR5_9RHOB|nr:hypothetical protein [Oceaniovalibus guishaninsula]EKE45429.1 hypothetical protein OCGS_0519 [Oceaniovalibus guishaninsula JLT2003]